MTYKIIIDISGSLGAGEKGEKSFMESLKAQFVDHLPLQKGERKVRLISITEEDE